MEKTTIICPPLRALKTTTFNEGKAKQLMALGLSANKTMNWVYERIYSEHGYVLLDHECEIIDIQSGDQEMLKLLDTLGGKECLTSVMKRYLRRAKGEHQNQLPHHLVFFVTMVHHSLEIDRLKQAEAIEA